MLRAEVGAGRGAGVGRRGWPGLGGRGGVAGLRLERREVDARFEFWSDTRV